MTTSWPLLGRDAELIHVARAMDDPDSGGVVLVGRAGVGKTRLATEALALAAERGMPTATVRATRSGADIPFAALAPLLPELDLPTEASVGLFRAAAAAVDARRGTSRLALLVDDAQLLDDASAALLDQLVEAGRVFAVLTVRSGDESGEVVMALWKDGRIERIDLQPLADADVRALASIAVGGPLEGSSLQALVTASAGNVLFLRELVQGAVESGALVEHLGIRHLEGQLASSPRLRDLIGHRLRGLAADQREAFELVALADPLPLDLAGRLVSIDAIEALESRLLVESHETLGSTELRLAHPLYGEVMRASWSPVRRTRLNRVLADAAETAGDLRPSDLLRVALWRLDGGGAGRPDITLQAARAAFRSGDYDLAVRLARSTWDDQRDVEAGRLLGEALDYAGRNDEAEEVLAAVTPLASTDRERSAVALRRSSNLFRALGRRLDAEQVLSDAAAAIDEPSFRRELDAVRADHLLLGGEVARAIELMGPLLAEPGDAAFAQASLDFGTSLALAGRTLDAIRHTDAALAARLDLDDEAQLSAIGVYVAARALAQTEAGRLSEAGATAEAGYTISIERGNSDGQAWFASVLGRSRLIEGRLETAAHLFREAATIFRDLGHPGERWGLAGLALAGAQMGEREVATEALAELDAGRPTLVRLMDVDIGRARAWVARVSGDLAGARAHLWAAIDQAHEWGQLSAEAAAAHDLLRMGEVGAAVPRLEELGRQVDGDLMAARVTHARAVDTGDPKVAAEASSQFEVIGALLLAAETASLEATLAARGGLARRATAASARSALLAGRCERPRTPALTTPDGTERLSAREREVALLAAEGLSSREIGERLFVAVRTVDNHLQRVYVKLGISGRTELASAFDPGR